MLCAVRKRWNVAQRKPTNERQLSGRSRSHLRRRSRRTLPKRESACMEVLGIASSSDAKESYPDDLESYLTEAMHGDMHWELREAFGFRGLGLGSNKKKYSRAEFLASAIKRLSACHDQVCLPCSENYFILPAGRRTLNRVQHLSRAEQRTTFIRILACVLLPIYAASPTLRYLRMHGVNVKGGIGSRGGLCRHHCYWMMSMSFDIEVFIYHGGQHMQFLWQLEGS